jgi:endonuclease/exonuclease/phosphatase (EEP) superfamily protein YafD
MRGEVRVSRSIRIFSGNLWWGKADPDGLISLIREHEVDVFAAQELGFETAEAIATELPYGSLEPDSTYHGMGIALRHPGKYERIPLHYRDARRAVLDPGDWPGLAHAIDLVNVHFQAPHAMRPFPPPWVRWQQVRGLERFFGENPAPVCAVVGDYNASPIWPLYRRLRRQLRDGAVEVARREGRRAEATWGPKPESRRLLRIDHVLVRGLAVERFRVLPIPGSDHSGILMECRPAPDTTVAPAA